MLGLLDCLLHVITLLFSCVSREDGEFVELDAVHKRNPGLHLDSLVGFAVDANPGILHVHLIHDPVPLRSRLVDNEATEQFICLLGLINRKGFLGLEGLVQIGELLLPCFLLSWSLVFREVEERAHLLPDFHQCCEGFFYLSSCPLLFYKSEDGDDMDLVFFVIPRAIGWHLELCLVWEFHLDLLGFLFFM